MSEASTPRTPLSQSLADITNTPVSTRSPGSKLANLLHKKGKGTRRDAEAQLRERCQALELETARLAAENASLHTEVAGLRDLEAKTRQEAEAARKDARRCKRRGHDAADELERMRNELDKAAQHISSLETENAALAKQLSDHVAARNWKEFAAGGPAARGVVRVKAIEDLNTCGGSSSFKEPPESESSESSSSHHHHRRARTSSVSIHDRGKSMPRLPVLPSGAGATRPYYASLSFAMH
eukprot:m51a1_g8560 hypothetical protein (240) ;mRNA; f:170413-171826